MDLKTDLKYSKNSRPRGKLKQIGSSVPYTSYTRPLIKRLEIYENTFKFEPVIQQGINLVIDALIGALGEVEHPDKEIQEFCRYNLSRQQDLYCVDLITKIKEVTKITLWSGFSVTEPIYELEEGNVFLKDYITYHPTSLIIRTNKKGQLVENEDSFEGPHLKSGIYQTSFNNNTGETQLPLWKVALITYNQEFNNYYGRSIIENCYRWHVLKEAITDMMLTTLDHYGNPTTLVYVPKVMSGESEVNPITGETRPLSIQEVLHKQISDEYTPSNSNYLFIPFSDPQLKPSAQILSGTNNLGSSFLEAIKHCQTEIIRNLLIPYSLLSADNASADTFSERQIEIFNRIVSSLYKSIVVPFVNQTLYKLVKYNFNRESAKFPPVLPLRKTTRPEARVALMQMIRGLTEIGYLNPRNDSDWMSVREMVDALDRDMDKEDKKFVEDILVKPKEKPKPVVAKQEKSDKPNKGGTGSTNNTNNPEGSVKGSGSPGRPTGKPEPLSNSRLLKK